MFIKEYTKKTVHIRKSKLGAEHSYTRNQTIAVFKCDSCENYHIKFFDPKHDRTYTPAEWEQIITDGKEALYKALRVVREDPKFFA